MNNIRNITIEIMIFKVNVYAITPHMLVFSKNDDDLFLVDGEGYTLYEIKKYIRNYFKSNSNINVESNNK